MVETQVGAPDESAPRRKMSTARKTLIFLVVAALVFIAGVAGFGWWMQSRLDGMIDRIDDPFAAIPSRPEVPAQVDEQDQQPVNILVLGSDSRISAGDPSQWQIGAQRTDAIMLVHIDGDREGITLTSIPRDTWVTIPGWGQNKINAAFSFGGPPLMIQAVEDLTDVRIDHFVVTDFDSFSTMTDALGGVTITLSKPLQVGSETLAPGEQRLSGDEALVYVRQRYELSGGDFSRVQRQQNWMRSIMREVFEQDILGDMGKLTDFVETVAQSVTVDEGFSIGEMRNLLFSARNVRPGDVNFLTMPHNGVGRSDNGQSIVIFDEVNGTALFDAMKNDVVGEYLAENPDVVTRLPANPE
ncbi:LytR family transcriptional regulator [Flaviflexus salsibiostraticola]|uniref:LytR family transcriptional regulator n=1 Tax=Flaviflexus salsibiostraticola TaxID=1282737 RepID=A0A3Q8WSG0_9ACTO|nr:LCP family protein [Flaviflexus salsibiostraticola]AZN29222.1 LytR family transcriptional regulator [Flaviflexus salsibiostraticola]